MSAVHNVAFGVEYVTTGRVNLLSLAEVQSNVFILQSVYSFCKDHIELQLNIETF